uniref:C-type lectin domain-containing protein n=1 Tax=Cyprinodon variegatus TaxID=28743 RepID=A0A3Q2CLJ0_CYPVA
MHLLLYFWADFFSLNEFWIFSFYFSYWSENEPNGKTEENCADIKSFEIERSWNDESCSHKLNWICEMKLNP